MYKSRVHLKLGWIASLSLVRGLGKKTRRALRCGAAAAAAAGVDSSARTAAAAQT